MKKSKNLGVINWLESEMERHGVSFLFYSCGATIMLLLLVFELWFFGGVIGEAIGTFVAISWLTFWLVHYYTWREEKKLK